eukprot:4117332-Amphidinium_carterae.1
MFLNKATNTFCLGFLPPPEPKTVNGSENWVAGEFRVLPYIVTRRASKSSSKSRERQLGRVDLNWPLHDKERRGCPPPRE